MFGAFNCKGITLVRRKQRKCINIPTNETERKR